MSNYIGTKCCNYKDTLPMLNNNEECIICFNELDTKTALYLENIKCLERKCNCKGILHKKCFYQWHNENNTCPICSSTIVLKPTFISIIYRNKDKLSIGCLMIIVISAYIFFLINHTY